MILWDCTGQCLRVLSTVCELQDDTLCSGFDILGWCCSPGDTPAITPTVISVDSIDFCSWAPSVFALGWWIQSTSKLRMSLGCAFTKVLRVV
jgi:hypothetical protein